LKQFIAVGVEIVFVQRPHTALRLTKYTRTVCKIYEVGLNRNTNCMKMTEVDAVCCESGLRSCNAGPV
jgi:hypothetical protein